LAGLGLVELHFMGRLHKEISLWLADWLHFTGYVCEDNYDSAAKDISFS
jgi:hypothetical protein